MPPPVADESLKPKLDIAYKPLPGWDIKKESGAERWHLSWTGNAPFLLGRFQEYKYSASEITRGLARTAAHNPKVVYEPTDWSDLGNWTELIYPTSIAESGALFSVINAWDRAAMTFGFAQLAAHTGDDFLPFFRQLFKDLPLEARLWFPELDVIGGKLCYVKGSAYKSLERKVAPADGGYTASYYHGDLMGFFNPDRYHNTDLKPDPEELHGAARWLVWTMQSKPMRRLQVIASIANMKQSLKALHNKMLATAAVKAKYPKGVDGMRCDLLSVAIAAPHLSESQLPTIMTCLTKPDPIEAIRLSKYGPKGRSQNVHDGMKLREAKLKALKFDLAAGEPV